MKKWFVVLCCLAVSSLLTAPAANAGAWVLQGAPEIVKPYQEWDEQAGGKGKIYESGTDYVVYGFLSKEHGRTWWSKEKLSWSAPAPSLRSEEEISVQLRHETLTPGWGNIPAGGLTVQLIDGPVENFGYLNNVTRSKTVSGKAYKGGRDGKMTIEVICNISGMIDAYRVRFHYDWVEGATSSGTGNAGGTRTSSSIPSLAGDWTGWWQPSVNRGLCRIEQDGQNLVFINEGSAQSKGYVKNSTTVVATDWNLVGYLVNNGTRINWANNTYWTR